MSRRNGPNTYKNGILIHKADWGKPQFSDSCSLPINRHERKRILRKSVLKRLYRQMIGENENM